MAKVKCVRPFGACEVGDVVEVPDDAEVASYYFVPCGDDEAATVEVSADENDEDGK
jgi:hypothetical protein